MLTDSFHGIIQTFYTHSQILDKLSLEWTLPPTPTHLKLSCKNNIKYMVNNELVAAVTASVLHLPTA